MRWRGPLLLGAVWVLATCLATAVGLVSVHRVAGDMGGGTTTPLTSAKVHEALASVPPRSQPSTSAKPVPSRTPGHPASPAASSGPLRTARTKAGVVSARCVGNGPKLLYAAPADGWRTETSEDQEVSFTRSGETVTVHLSCAQQQVRVSVEDELPSPPGPGGSPAPTPEPSGSSEPEPGDTGSSSSPDS